jgi:Fe2+ transport system protein FeoA
MPTLTRSESIILTNLPSGKKAVIRRLEGGRGVLARLAAMGFTPGALITVLRQSDHGPLLVSLRIPHFRQLSEPGKNKRKRAI